MALKTASCELCPLCEGSPEPRVTTLPRRQARTFLHCKGCDLAFVERAGLPTPEAELGCYRLHQNDPADERYVAFLSRLAIPLARRLPPASRGLDFGCGPAPVLANLLTERGHPMAVYDPFFFPSEGVLWEPYDFVVCTEAAEHFHSPRTEFERLRALVRPGGWLGLMTAFRKDWNEFPGWHYHRDPTHVAFYSERTLSWIADSFGFRLEIPEPGVALLQRL
jgi:hypothetical protein